jgi:hypothetical protein
MSPISLALRLADHARQDLMHTPATSVPHALLVNIPLPQATAGVSVAKATVIPLLDLARAHSVLMGMGFRTLSPAAVVVSSAPLASTA